MNSMLICTHDDRPQAQTGIRLLLLSLAEHCPDVDVLVSWPIPDPAFISWLKARPGVQVYVEPSFLGKQWNIKPDLLLHCLTLGYRQVVWIDSDILVARDFRGLLSDLDDETVVVAEDFYWAVYTYFGGTARARLWGLHPGRRLPWTANTGILRVTPSHQPLLNAWSRLLTCPAYLRAHRRTWYTRPVHMVGDQDVLTALLSSRRFSHIPVHFVRRGKEIIYNFGPSGYTPGERFGNLTGQAPPFIHCSGPKPWEAPVKVSLLADPKKYYARVGLELADYSRLARYYREQLDSDTIAFDLKTLPARLFCALAGKRIPLQGLPLALLHGFGRRLRKLFGFNYWPHETANLQPGEQPDGEAMLGPADNRQRVDSTVFSGTIREAGQ
ncbi:MAG: nucleotide-diphospho-sugar transferase [Gammaproteobacteria bacterium]|nr:nucleotide-diphospho-sugar transferase [Gammaproteobacteria bacterium]